MGPESVLIFSLSILLICGNSGIYTSIILPSPNFHLDLNPARPHLELTSKNVNGSYQEDADPRAAPAPFLGAADAAMDFANPMEKGIGDVISFAVSNAVQKMAVNARKNSEKPSNNTTPASEKLTTVDDGKTNSSVNNDSIPANVGNRELSAQEAEQEQSTVAYDDDGNESELANSTNKFSNTSDADQSKIEPRFLSAINSISGKVGIHINPTLSIKKNVVVVNRKNNSQPDSSEPGDPEGCNQPSADGEQQDDPKNCNS